MANTLIDLPTKIELINENLSLNLNLVLHCQRVADIALQIGKELGLDKRELIELYKAANLHDIGKAYISDKILYKPGKLTSAEKKEIINHSVYGSQILAAIPQFKQYSQVVLLHHENYDGSGYFGKSGEIIPLHSRIITIADCYDALTNNRPYRKAYEINEALEIMCQEASYKYDPKIFNIFLRIIKKYNTEIC